LTTTPYEPPSDARELLFVSDYVLASLRKALGATYESIEKWWVIRGPFNGALLCVPTEDGPPRSVYPIGFFRPGDETNYTSHHDPRRRLFLGDRMNLLIIDASVPDRPFPQSLQDTVRHAEEQGVEEWSRYPERRDAVRRVLFFTQLRVRPDEDASAIARDLAGRLAATLQGEWLGSNPHALFHEWELQGGSARPEPDGALFHDFDFEVRLPAAVLQPDVVSALQTQYPDMSSPIFGNWAHIGHVEKKQGDSESPLCYARIVTRHF